MRHTVNMWALAFSTLLFTACNHQPTMQSTDNALVPNHTSPAAASAESLKVIAYYMGDGSDVENYNIGQLTHIIYSFLHLRGNQLSFRDDADKNALRRLVALKKNHPQLKVLISLGGWGGCETCSEVFSSAEGRLEFAKSTLNILQEYNADGIDLDWEYPSVPGFPGHKYSSQDKPNFTALIQILRKQFNTHYELSFAAGGFDYYIREAVDWKAIMPLLNSVNLMSYDMVNGGTPHTGHHTPLYSTPDQQDSTDNAVTLLLDMGVPPEKIVIGAAFYARAWKNVANINNGLYQGGTHTTETLFKDYANKFTPANGYEYFWDDTAKAPYVYNAQKKLFATFDDRHSLTEKIRYIRQHKLGGIMFWQLPQDVTQDGLLSTIYREKVMPEGQQPKP